MVSTGALGTWANAPVGRPEPSSEAAVPSQVGNDSANPCKLPRQRAPIIAIERCGMQQDNRQPLARLAETQSGVAGNVLAVHI